MSEKTATVETFDVVSLPDEVMVESKFHFNYKKIAIVAAASAVVMGALYWKFKKDQDEATPEPEAPTEN